MGAPILRRYTRAAPLALGAFLPATDDQSGLTFTRIAGPNQIQDIINAPDPGALTYEIRLLKAFQETGRSFFSEMLNPASAGRVAVGPVDLRGGDYAYNVQQRAGALTAYSFAVKYAGAVA